MLRNTISSLAARKRQLLTTSLAVMIGVAFLAGTLVLTGTIGRAFDQLLADANAGTDVYLRGELVVDDDMLGEQRALLDTSLLDQVRAVDGVAAAEGHVTAYAQLVGSDGELVGNPAMGAPVMGGAWLADDQLNPFDLERGRAPVDDLEVVIDRGSAERGGLDVGDTTRVLTQSGALDVTVVGIATFAGADSPGGASVTMFAPPFAEAHLTAPGRVDAIKVLAEDGVSPDELVERISPVLPRGVDILTGDEVTAEDQASLKEDLQFLNTFLLVFAVIALFVGSFIIYNSFSILVAQRTKELAVLRAIGASRKQVTRTVLAEAVAVGLIAAAAGLVGGIGVAHVLRALFTQMGIDFPTSGLVVAPTTVLASLGVGVGVSVTSAVLPARRAAKVPPIAALRDVAVDSSARGRRRIVLGVAVTVSGALMLAVGLFGGVLALLGLGAPVVFVGVAILGPVLAAPASAVLGWPAARLRGVPGTLARANAIRNPKRTSATASALMIGVSLVAMITILASSTKASIASSVDEAFQGDVVVDGGGFGTGGGLSVDVADRIAALPQVAAATGHRLAAVQVDGQAAVLSAVDPGPAAAIVDLDVTDGSLADLGPTELAVLDDVAADRGWSVGDEVEVRFAETGPQRFTVAALYDEPNVLGEYVISTAAHDANVAERFDVEVLVAGAEGVPVDDVVAAVEGVTADLPQADVLDHDGYAEVQTRNMDTILSLVYALLGLGVLIALLGIANTLALSIHERTRELGLLRAVGMTRAQLRRTVRYEAVVIALLGTALGLGLGSLFGWAVVRSLGDQGMSTLALPVGQLAVIAGIGALAGVGAAVLPARRASRLDVLEAITTA